jgi:serine/threonine protein kinase
VCEILLYHGELTNINAKTTDKRTPMHLACFKGHTPAVELFIQEEANVNCLDIDQNTPLHYASMFGHVDIVKKLLKAKAKAGLRNLKGYYPIDIAASSQIVKTIKRYFKRKKDIVISCGYGRTALHGHILNNSRLDVVNRLLSNAQFLNKDSDMQSRLPRNSIQEFSARASTTPKPTEQIDIRKAGPDDFEGLGLLGRGSFGEVYLVRERRTQKVYALKILRKSEVVGTNIVKYTYTERNILSTIKHPFIVSLHSSFQTKEKLALVMDYCPGGDLGSYITREGKFSEDRARIYLCEVLLALEELHNNGIIFRDLKPENIVLDREGHAILTDFGLSKEGVVHGQLQKSFCGSIAYLAPEMLKRKGHDKNVDWYLLGALLYEMLHGEPPFYCEDQDILFNRILKGRLEISKELSDDAKDLLKRVISIQLLERNPRKRLGSGRRDAYEIKKHPFFKKIDWDDVKRRKLKPPPPISYNKKLKKADRNEMFGYSGIKEETKLDGWSFVHNPNRTKK